MLKFYGFRRVRGNRLRTNPLICGGFGFVFRVWFAGIRFFDSPLAIVTHKTNKRPYLDCVERATLTNKFCSGFVSSTSAIFRVVFMCQRRMWFFLHICLGLVTPANAGNNGVFFPLFRGWFVVNYRTVSGFGSFDNFISSSPNF